MDFSDYIRKLQAQPLYYARLKEQSNNNNLVGNVNFTSPGNNTLINQSYPCGNVCSGGCNVLGSYAFQSDVATYINVNNSPLFNIGSNPFTIEWFQLYQPGLSQNPRVFSIGNDSSPSTINFSFQANTSPAYNATSFSTILTTGSKIFNFGDFGGTRNYQANISSLINQWVYCVLEGNGSNLLNFYVNGNKFGSTIDTNLSNINNNNTPTARYNIVNDYITNPYLTIGSEYIQVAGTNFKGNITNFRYTVGSALYVSSFSSLTISTPITSLGVVAGTDLLLLANSNNPYVDSSPASNIVSNANTAVYWQPLTPFTYLSNVDFSPF
jgi:hypothetical protein